MDFFFLRPRARREAASTPAPTSPAPAGGADWAARITPTAGRQSLLVPAWHRGVSLIMQTMGQMLVQYQRLNREGGNFIEDRYGDARRLNYLLQIRPNPLMTASQLMQQIEYRKIYFGNAYVLIQRDALSGTPAALYLATSGAYSLPDDTYTLTYTRRGGTTTATVPASDVLHFRNVFLSDDHLLGIPTMQFAARALSIAATADLQSLTDMAKGGRHKLLVQEQTAPGGPGVLSAGRASQTELRRITDQLGEEWLSRDAVFLNNVADVKVISQTAAELKTLETRGFEVADLARILGVPRAMLMDDTNSSYKTPEAATQEFLLRTIQPRIREMEDEANAKLLGIDDFGRRRIHICEQALRRLDPAGQAALDRTHLETGAMSVNEIRRQYDLPAVPEGDTLYLSTNLAALGSDKLAHPAPAAPAQDTPAQDTGDDTQTQTQL